MVVTIINAIRCFFGYHAYTTRFIESNYTDLRDGALCIYCLHCEADKLKYCPSDKKPVQAHDPDL